MDSSNGYIQVFLLLSWLGLTMRNHSRVFISIWYCPWEVNGIFMRWMTRLLFILLDVGLAKSYETQEYRKIWVWKCFGVTLTYFSQTHAIIRKNSRGHQSVNGQLGGFCMVGPNQNKVYMSINLSIIEIDIYESWYAICLIGLQCQYFFNMQATGSSGLQYHWFQDFVNTLEDM